MGWSMIAPAFYFGDFLGVAGWDEAGSDRVVLGGPVVFGVGTLAGSGGLGGVLSHDRGASGVSVEPRSQCETLLGISGLGECGWGSGADPSLRLPQSGQTP